MRSFQLSLIFYFFVNVVSAQNSKCQEDFKWLTNYIENNLPAYQNDINDANKADYLVFKAALKQEAVIANSVKSCFKPMVKYTEYFFDNHTRLVSNSTIQVDESSEESILKFKESDVYKSVERVAIDVDSMKQKYSVYPRNDIEGLYVSNGGAYEVALVKNNDGHRDYIGIILSSKSSLWEPGMVKFELINTGDNTFDAFYYYRNHSIVFNADEVFDKGTLTEGWSKSKLSTTEEKDSRVNETPRSLFHFEKLNNTTNYLYLGSFDGALKPRYDSLYKAIAPKIKELPNLIVDIRNNGGGSDANIKFLREIMYTGEYEGGRQQIWNSDGVQAQYENFLEKVSSDPSTYGKDTIKWVKFMLKRIKKGDKNSFIYTSRRKRPMKFKGKEYPKKIVVIQSKFTGSTAENVVISAMNSDKTTTIGDNTGGYIGYGNIFDKESPSGAFKLWASTTQNDYKMQFEANGIPPQIKLSQDVDWVEEALKIFEK